MRTGEEWRDIPGFGGWYQASNRGRVRSLRAIGYDSKGKVAERPRILRPTIDAAGRERLVFHIDGEQKTQQVHRLIYSTWVGAIPDGMIVCHRNSNQRDNAPSNLFLTTPQKRMAERGRKIGGRNRRPVVKLNRSFEVIEAYRSATQAAKENHFPDKSVIVRICNFRYRSAPFASDGFLYAWDEDSCLRRAIQLAAADMERRGERFTAPPTEEYYSIPPAPERSIDLDALTWASALPLAGGGALRSLSSPLVERQ